MDAKLKALLQKMVEALTLEEANQLEDFINNSPLPGSRDAIRFSADIKHALLGLTRSRNDDIEEKS